MNFDWNELAFASKKPINELNATFIAAPRELSIGRFTQIVKTYLPKGNIVLGLAKERYVSGLEDQRAFRMLQLETVQSIIDKVNAASPNKIAVLNYFQRDLPFLLEKLDFPRAVFVNGSWYHAFHLRPEYYALTKRRLSYELISPFTDQYEAEAYVKTHQAPTPWPIPGHLYTESEMLNLANAAAKQSFASSEAQTGVALGRKIGHRYEFITTSYNKIVPYETYAMHEGSSREKNFSLLNDLNNYDCNHAEVELIAKATRDDIDLAGTTLFINLLPCPTCARLFTATLVEEFVYTVDHSEGYALKLLESAGKTVRRLVVQK